MARSQHELASLRQQTTEFINSDPTELVIIRPTKVDDGAGGWTEGAPVELAPQTVKIQPASGGLARREPISPSAGSVDETLHHVIGQNSLDIQKNDEFDWNGHHWEVTFVDNSLSYRTMAEAVHSGD